MIKLENIPWSIPKGESSCRGGVGTSWAFLQRALQAEKGTEKKADFFFCLKACFYVLVLGLMDTAD